MFWKKCVRIHCEETTLWSWPEWQKYWTETTVEEANQCQKPPVGPAQKKKKDRAIQQWNIIIWADELKFEIFRSNRRVYVQWRVREKAANHSITPIVKHGQILYDVFVCVGRAFAYSNVGYVHQMKGKLNQISYHSVLHHHTIPSWMRLVGQRFKHIKR